jgi:uncharacterized protein (DUF1330 family)
MAITPDGAQLAQLVEDSQRLTGEVVMLNLLKYKERSGDGAGSGQDAYGRYADQVVQMVEAQGGTVVWMGTPDQVLIGDPEADAWDAVALVRYPSRTAFMEMASSAPYQEAHHHREAGLERTVLLPMTPGADWAAPSAPPA